MSGLPNLQKLIGGAEEIRAYHAEETDEIPGGQDSVKARAALADK